MTVYRQVAGKKTRSAAGFNPDNPIGKAMAIQGVGGHKRINDNRRRRGYFNRGYCNASECIGNR